MEVRRRSLRGKTQRKPLADCTNTVSRKTSQHSSSSSSATLAVKFANPNLTSSLKRLLDQTTLKNKTDDVDNIPKAAAGNSSPSLSATVSPETRRKTADLDFPIASPSQGLSEKEIVEPYSVYTVRRKASGFKRSRDTSRKITNRGNENELTPLNVAPKKRQRKVKDEEDDLGYGVSQDYIEQQRAYFAEVDAFELAEEEVSSSDLD